MKKKKWMIIGAIALIVLVAAVLISRMPNWLEKWSEKSFEAIVQEVVTQPDGEVRLIVERTTEIYSDPLNSLAIREETEFVDEEGKARSITDFNPGDRVKVTLKDAFVEEIPFYYPTVYEIRLMRSKK